MCILNDVYCIGYIYILTIENGRHVTKAYKPLSLKKYQNKKYNHLLVKIYICSCIIKEYSITTSNNLHISKINVLLIMCNTWRINNVYAINFLCLLSHTS